MRLLFSSLLALTLGVAVVGCHHTAGFCDCDCGCGCDCGCADGGCADGCCGLGGCDGGGCANGSCSCGGGGIIGEPFGPGPGPGPGGPAFKPQIIQEMPMGPAK